MYTTEGAAFAKNPQTESYSCCIHSIYQWVNHLTSILCYGNDWRIFYNCYMYQYWNSTWPIVSKKVLNLAAGLKRRRSPLPGLGCAHTTWSVYLPLCHLLTLSKPALMLFTATLILSSWYSQCHITSWSTHSIMYLVRAPCKILSSSPAWKRENSSFLFLLAIT